MSAPDFLVHDKADTVGVVVVETVAAGKTLTGLVMADGSTVKVKAREAIPLGHKVALKDFAPDEAVTKYGHDIGRIAAAVKAGGHVHVHNLKTRRW